MRTVLALAIMMAGCDFGFCGSPDSTQREASLYVSASGKPVASTFTENGAALSAFCGEEEADGACVSQVILLDPGIHEILVSAEGYQPTTVEVDTTSLDSVHLAVELIPENR